MSTIEKPNREETPAAFYACVSGRVQGVGFRYSAVREASRLRLNGWVKNSANGDVEVWVEGSPEQLSLFLAWLRRGPEYSHVEFVDKENKEPRGYSGFDVKF